ncbi:MAG: 16S rRNA (cytidine(1402)-2'-O)-methyltransferase [Bacteroidota bacterium]|nr:16S rRNA (cytidine(1402)-2'-O)-methyltransferase [Bacteroidota bacterium]MDX5430730.1 16S rRNA (cytidine(1402)-2'-O)-methyltransferase [Bacteroidota bacterium]MDX5469477.1 16S rRNA (cytidine(1402)-2'-O)-methyltransferase [Bacteroidota bacterium]
MTFGILYIVPTPIGNLEDMSFRAIRILKEVDLILAEDTRTSGQLLKHFEVSTRMASFHLHNEHKVLASYMDRLKQGESLALISDAGTPAISDPGFLLVREAIREGVEVCCLPGATAFVPALVMSGFPSDRFVFEGFLPLKKGRQTRLQELSEEFRTLVFYESPHRIEKCLEQMLPIFGSERQICLVREISKKFEEKRRGTIAEVLESVKKQAPKGELVVVVEGLSR